MWILCHYNKCLLVGAKQLSIGPPKRHWSRDCHSASTEPFCCPFPEHFQDQQQDMSFHTLNGLFSVAPHCPNCISHCDNITGGGHELHSDV